MYIEKRLYELDNKLSMYHENVRRLTGLLQVVEQIHRAPRVYVGAITEVARRHAFSKAFVEVSVYCGMFIKYVCFWLTYIIRKQCLS